MVKNESMDDLAKAAIMMRAELGAQGESHRLYKSAMRGLLKRYEDVAGHRIYSLKLLREVTETYFEDYDSEKTSQSTWQRYRRAAADLEDMHDYGAIFYPPVNLSPYRRPRNELLRPVPDEVKNDPENVIGLSFAVLSEMKRVGFATRTMQVYLHAALPRVISYFMDHGTTTYSDELVESLIEQAKVSHEGHAGKTSAQVVSAALHLRSVHRTGRLCESLRGDGAFEQAKQGAFGEIIAEYAQWRGSRGCKASTIKVDVGYILPFLTTLCPNGPDDLLDVTCERVRGARATLSEGRSSEYVTRMLTPIRNLARFMEETHPEYPQIEGWIGKSPRTVAKRPFEGYADEHVDAIIADIDGSSPTGKRNLAIAKLLKSTGVRACDIASLDLGDIDWRENEITFVQGKTGVPIAVPLDTETGEAIATYLLEARRSPDPGCEAVFVTASGSAKRLSAKSAGSAIRRHSKAACGPEFKGKHGPHSFRRRLGAKLVESGASLGETADVLGHTSADSARPYAAVAVERLRICCASLGNVPLNRKEGDHGRA